MKPSSGATVSGGSVSTAALTVSLDARPAWQTVQVAFAPNPSSITPEGRATASSACASSTWQEAQPITALIAAGWLTTPGSRPSVPRKSRKPGCEWQAAQFSGTAPSSFQWVKDSEV